MVVTNNRQLADKAKYLSTQAKDDPVEYLHEEIGYNYRLTNIQAALGVAQMEHLDDYLSAKREIKRRYKQELNDLPGVEIHEDSESVLSACWMSAIKIDAELFGYTSREVMSKLTENKIQSRPLWHPINSLRPYQNCQSYQVEVANQLYREVLSLPCSVGLTASDQSRVIAAIRGLAN